jgi:hypothetical protein
VAALPDFQGEKNAAIATASPLPAWVVRGDTVTWYAGITGWQDNTPHGYDDRWFPKPEVYDFWPAPATSVQNPQITWLNDFQTTACAPGAPYLGYTGVLWDGWCMGVGVFTVTVENADLIPSVADRNIEVTPAEWIIDISRDPKYGNTLRLSGPDNSVTGVGAGIHGYLYVVDPELTVVKEVCSTGTGCDPAADLGADGWTAAADPASPDARQIEWRVTAQNTGNITLSDVHLAQDSLDLTAADQEKLSTDGCAAAAADGAVFGNGILAPGASASLVCKTVFSAALANPVTNTAAANGTFNSSIKDPNGVTLISRFTGNDEASGATSEAKVPSNEAAASFQQPRPGLTLAKYVCQTGADCATPTGDTLASLADAVPAGGWVKQATVPYGSDVEWLLVAKNTGTTRLSGTQVLSDALSTTDGNKGLSGCDTGASFAPALIDPGQAAILRCVAKEVTNTDSLSTLSEDGLVLHPNAVGNLASAQATPAAADGSPLAYPIRDGGTLTSKQADPIKTPLAIAEANTELPNPKISIVKYDILGGDDSVSGDYGTAPGKLLDPATPTPVKFTITNVGNELLRDITVSDELIAGGAYLTDLSCDKGEATDGGWLWAGPLAVGDSFACAGTVPALGVSQIHEDSASVVAEGYYSGIETDDNNSWNAHTVNPQLDLAKWVCGTGTGCPVPAAQAEMARVGDTDDPFGNWVPETEIPYSADAEWLLVFHNSGDTDLADVTLTEEDSLVGSDRFERQLSTCHSLEGQSLNGLLPAGDYAVLTCQTIAVRASLPADGGTDADKLINQAQAQGLPVDADGKPFEVATGLTPDEVGQIPPVISPEVSAKVWTDQPEAAITVQKYDAEDGWPEGNHDEIPKLVPPGEPVTVVIWVRNDGSDDLKDIAIWDDEWTGPADTTAVDFDLTCDFTPWGGPASVAAGSDGVVRFDGVAPSGTGIYCTGVMPGLAVDESHHDRIHVSGTGVETDKEVHDTDPWNAHSPSASLELTKWVCQTGTTCDNPKPASDELASLAAGQPALGWVKAASVGPGADVDWLIVVSNASDPVDQTYYLDVAVADDTLTGDGHGATSAECATGAAITGRLDPGAAVYIRCTTAAIENTAALGSGLDVVNTATASAVVAYAVDIAKTDIKPVLLDDGPWVITTGPDSAEANTATASLALQKWVCQAGTGCSNPTAATLTQLAAGTAAGGWVDQTTVSYGASAQWLIVVQNTGATTLNDVKLTREDLNAGGAGHGATTGCAVNQVIADSLKPGAAASLTCVTNAITNQASLTANEAVVNTAAASGTPVDSNGEPIIQHVQGPDGEIVEEPMTAPTAEDTAKANATAPVSGLTLAKWVCQAGTGCLDPTAEQLSQLAAGTAAGGWADRTTVAYGASAQWLIVVQNTGATTLNDVKLTREDLDAGGGGHGATTGCAVNQTIADSLKPGDTAWLTCQTDAIVNQSPLGSGAEVVNTAAAQGTPTDENGDPLPPVPSNEDTAETDTVAPASGLVLAKWVCQAEAGCPDPTAEQLDRLAAGTAVGDWTDQATVSYGASAQWLVVVQNTGATTLNDVKLTREDLNAGGGGHGATTGCAVNQTIADSLKPGDTAWLTCQTDAIVNLAALGSDADVVNTAAAQGAPIDDNGNPVIGPDGDPLPPVQSGEDTAEANTVPLPTSDVEVVKFDTLGNDNEITGDYDEAPGKPLEPGSPFELTITVKNTGQEALTNISVQDIDWTGPGSSADFGLTCDFSAFGGPAEAVTWAGPLPIGQSFDCHGVVPALDAGQEHSDTVSVAAEGQISGTPTTDDDEWHGFAVRDGIDLEKLVCASADGCVAPVETNLAALEPTALTAAGWVKQATVDFGTEAQWLLVIRNTGDTYLKDVQLLTESVSGNGHGDTSNECQVGDNLGVLAPGAARVLSCTTADITNTAPWASGLNVVNTAVATGTPCESDLDPLLIPGPDGEPSPAPNVTSLESQAEVNTKAQPSIVVDKYDTLEEDDAVTGDYDEAPGKVLEPGVATPIRIAVTNNGTEDLVNITVAEAVWEGPGQGEFALTCDFSPLGGPSSGTAWAGPFLIGDRFVCTGTIPGLQPGDIHADEIRVTAEGRWSGAPVEGGDEWHGHIPVASVELSKWVCETGTGCASPDDDAVNALAAGEPAGGWADQATVDFGTAADWLILAVNTGQTYIKDLVLTREDFEAGGTGYGDTTCAVGQSLLPDGELLAPGWGAWLICSTADITNPAALGSGADVVNTAAAEGIPVDENGNPVPGPGDVPLEAVKSNEDSANVNTILPLPPEIPSTGAKASSALAFGGFGALLFGFVLVGRDLISRRRRNAN